MNLPGLKIIIRLVCVVVITILGCQGIENRQGNIAYPTPVPDSIPMIYLTGIVSSDSVDFNSAFSPDGCSYYFSRRSNKQSDMFVTHFRENKWSPPIETSFNTAGYSEADPAFDREGRIYFISDRPKDDSDSIGDYDIWFASPLPDGKWTAPTLLNAVHSDGDEYYISFSQSGNLYFASNRAGGFGEEDIYKSRFADGQFNSPENLGGVINTVESEYDPGISPDEKRIVFTSSGRADTFGGGDLYASVFGKNQSWEPVVHLDSIVNTTSRDFCSYFSPDGKFFFYSSGGDVKWMKVNLITRQMDAGK